LTLGVGLVLAGWGDSLPGQTSPRRTANGRPDHGQVEQRLGLTRQWHASFPAAITNPGNEPIKFVIPREATVAFSLTKEAVTGPNSVTVPDSVEMIVILEAGGTKELVSSRERGLHGRILGIDGALQLAQVRKELLERRGMTVTESVQFVPTARVYSLSRDGHLQAMDAESGSVLWSKRLEAGVAPILGYDVSDTYVAVTHGTHIDVFDAQNGAQIRRFNLQNLPDGPPTISGSRVISPGSNGRMELLTPYQSNRFRSDMGGFHGRLALAITELENAYVWAVSDQIYVSLKPEPARPVFSIPTSRPLRIAPGGFGNMMLVVEETGGMSCFSQSSGLEVWSQYLGVPLVQSPVFIRWNDAAEAGAEGAVPVDKPAGNEADAAVDPFGAAAPAADPFAARGAAPPAASAQDPFAAGAAADPFAAANPFGPGAPARGPDLSADEDAAEMPAIRVARKVDVESLLGTSDQVAALLVDEAGRVQAVDMRTGTMVSGFLAHGIRKILTVTPERIYAVSQNNELVALEVRTGNRLGAMAIPGDWEGVVNRLSDRVYLQSRTGQVVCFRPLNSVAPKYRAPAQIADLEEAASGQEAGGAARESEEFNPFGTSPMTTPPSQPNNVDPLANPFG
jgi:outer membrane protein assembly factor BamB